jgi:hypothetical protein
MFIVLVKADEGCSDLVVPKQVAGSPSVFSCDYGNLSEYAQGTKCDVLEVANWRRDHEQRPAGGGATANSVPTGRGIHARILLYDWELGHCRMSRLGEDVLDDACTLLNPFHTSSMII